MASNTVGSLCALSSWWTCRRWHSTVHIHTIIIHSDKCVQQDTAIGICLHPLHTNTHNIQFESMAGWRWWFCWAGQSADLTAAEMFNAYFWPLHTFNTPLRITKDCWLAQHIRELFVYRWPTGWRNTLIGVLASLPIGVECNAMLLCRA